jgi:hypothetical protein
VTWVMVAKNLHGRTICSRTLLVIFTLISTLAVADEGGISLWLPGQFGSLAAAPQQPGWSFANIYYHTSVSAGGDVAAARQFTTKAFTRTATANLNASLNAHADLDFVSVNRVFETRVLGGQLAVGVTSAAGYNSTSINGTLAASIGNLTATRTGSTSDARGGVVDLYPLASLRWNSGINNFMVYMMGDISVGTYDPARLANIGIGDMCIGRSIRAAVLLPYWAATNRRCSGSAHRLGTCFRLAACTDI